MNYLGVPLCVCVCFESFLPSDTKQQTPLQVFSSGNAALEG